MRKSRWFAVMILVVLAAVAYPVVRALRPGVGQVSQRKDRVVPVLDKEKVDFSLDTVSSLPVVNPMQLGQAMELVLTLEGEEELNTAEDRKIMALLKDFFYDRIRIPIEKRQIRANEKSGVSTMAYSCVHNVFAIDPTAQTTTPMLAMTIYHEMVHAMKCREEMSRFGLTSHSQMAGKQSQDVCEHEGPAWAAQVRLFAVLLRKGLLDKRLSTQDTRDLSGVNLLLGAWEAHDEGRFCPWYQEMLQTGDKRESYKYIELPEE